MLMMVMHCPPVLLLLLMMKARLMRIQAAVQEADALGGFYRLVIEQCQANPAKDTKRLECLDQQVGGGG